jgi:hypothetical protein
MSSRPPTVTKVLERVIGNLDAVYVVSLTAISLAAWDNVALWVLVLVDFLIFRLEHEYAIPK